LPNLGLKVPGLWPNPVLKVVTFSPGLGNKSGLKDF
jgi:hypothetical protein